MEPRIAQDTADFRKLRENGCIYVDKTAILHELACDPTRSLYFISRPRRFGKSLMLSTLECLFRGQRELFKGLAIDKLDYDWAEYPVLHFNFAGLKVETLEAFERDFRNHVRKVLIEAGCKWDGAIFPHANFAKAINFLKQINGKCVVILIDDYDAPINAALNDVAKAKAIRSELINFCGEIKNEAADIRFSMMTGITRYVPDSIFSTLNNLNDLTLDDRYATLLGYTDEELESTFDVDMHAHAEVMGLAYEDYRTELRRWYSGYRFARWNTTKVYNPASIAKTLGAKEKTFVSTWTNADRPALINALTARNLTEEDYDNVKHLSEEDLDICDLEAITANSILYQGGYLSIKAFKNPCFTLGVPNEEVRRALYALLAEPLA